MLNSVRIYNNKTKQKKLYSVNIKVNGKKMLYYCALNVQKKNPQKLKLLH